MGRSNSRPAMQPARPAPQLGPCAPAPAGGDARRRTGGREQRRPPATWESGRETMAPGLRRGRRGRQRVGRAHVTCGELIKRRGDMRPMEGGGRLVRRAWETRAEGAAADGGRRGGGQWGQGRRRPVEWARPRRPAGTGEAAADTLAKDK
jgi:hypothetical protein